MRITTSLMALAGAGLLVAAALFAQDSMEAPRAGAEHKMLQQRVGVWDADFKMHMGTETVEDKATMTYTMLGDFWLVGNYEGSFMGAPFKGHEMTTFDPETNKFVSCWVDTTGPMMAIARGTYDAATHTMMLTSEQNDPMTGKKNVNKTVAPDADTMKFTMTPEGEREPAMEINYTRRK